MPTKELRRFIQNKNLFLLNIKINLKMSLSYKYSAIESVGVYVPGGTASYPSTVLMNCVPAIVAGVKNIYLNYTCFRIIN